MPSYRVCFFNEIPRNGQLFRCCQRSIVIRAARSRERAIEAAKKRFARLEGVPHWEVRARVIEIEPIDAKPKPERPGSVPADAERHGRRRRAPAGNTETRDRQSADTGADNPDLLRREELGPEERFGLAVKSEARRQRGKPPSI